VRYSLDLSEDSEAMSEPRSERFRGIPFRGSGSVESWMKYDFHIFEPERRSDTYIEPEYEAADQLPVDREKKSTIVTTIKILKFANLMFALVL